MQQVSLAVTHVTPEIINYICDKIVDVLNPQKIVLFGSHARGASTSTSDVDLLIIHDTEQSNREVRRKIERLFLDRRFGLDLIVRTPEEVALNIADGNPFYTKHIFGKGRVLYERKGVQASR